MPIEDDANHERDVTQQINVLGVGISAVNIPDTIARIETWIEKGEREYICVTGIHGVMESVRDERIRLIHNAAGLVVPDGMPLVWLLKAAGFKHADRVYGPDLMLAFFERSQAAGHRHYLYGTVPTTLSLLEVNLQRRFPRARIVGSYSPAFRSPGALETDDVIAAINRSEADIVWVGLATPKQEWWMARHRHRLVAPVLIGVGAAFDFHAGLVRQAPPFFQRLGLEWAFRTAMEPRRLAKRYLRNNPAFLALLLAQRAGLRRFDLR